MNSFQQNSLKKHELILGLSGLFLFIFSTYAWLTIGNVLFVILHLFGMSVFLEALVTVVGIRNIFNDTPKKLKYLLKIFLLGGIVGIVFFDFISVFLFGIWEYDRIFSPSENILVYIFTAFPAWGFYFLIFHQSYQLFHRIIHRKYHFRDRKIQKYSAWIGVSGIALFLIGVTLPKLNIEPFIAATLAAFGGWFILEGFELSRKRPTLLSDIVNGNFRPLVAIVLGAIILGFISEYTNLVAPVQQWNYYGIPFENIAIAGIPVLLLISWSWMYIVFLSLENVTLINKEEFWD